MSRLPMLPGRVPAVAVRLSRPEDPRSVAESLYEESLGDDAGSMLCELLDLMHGADREIFFRPTVAAITVNDGLDIPDDLRRS